MTDRSDHASATNLLAQVRMARAVKAAFQPSTHIGPCGRPRPVYRNKPRPSFMANFRRKK